MSTIRYLDLVLVPGPSRIDVNSSLQQCVWCGLQDVPEFSNSPATGLDLESWENWRAPSSSEASRPIRYMDLWTLLSQDCLEHQSLRGSWRCDLLLHVVSPDLNQQRCVHAVRRLTHVNRREPLNFNFMDSHQDRVGASSNSATRSS